MATDRHATFALTDDRHDVSPGLRALVSYDPLAGWGAADGVLWRDNSVRFWGELRVMSVPPGSEWADFAFRSANSSRRQGGVKSGTALAFPA